MAPTITSGLNQSVEDSKCEYRRLGNSGLRISVPIFGCMSVRFLINYSYRPYFSKADP
jgi:hypothetical protein